MCVLDIDANPKDSELLLAERELNILLMGHRGVDGRQIKWETMFWEQEREKKKKKNRGIERNKDE